MNPEKESATFGVDIEIHYTTMFQIDVPWQGVISIFKERRKN